MTLKMLEQVEEVLVGKSKLLIAIDCSEGIEQLEVSIAGREDRRERGGPDRFENQVQLIGNQTLHNM